MAFNKDLSIIIPASNKNGIFINKTIEDILINIEMDTEIIVVYNGAWPDPGIPQHERINMIHYVEKIGQRVATNTGVRLSKAKYVMKLDAHCSFDKGFDRKLIENMQDNWTVAPIMKNLHAFNWKCYKCGAQWYQGPTPIRCMKVQENKLVENRDCSGADFRRKMIWKPRRGTHSTSYSFDAEPHFQYFNNYTIRPEYKETLEKTGLTESMSLQGSCFMCTREKYWELDICDETVGSWGNQGIEVACKTWLSGGRVIINHKTWYAHMFRTQGGDFGFSHPMPGNEVLLTKKKVWDLFFNNNWPKQIYPVSWLIEKFWPVPGWTQESLDKIK